MIVGFDSLSGVPYGIEGRTTIIGTPTILTNVTGTGQRLEVPLPINTANRFMRLTVP